MLISEFPSGDLLISKGTTGGCGGRIDRPPESFEMRDKEKHEEGWDYEADRYITGCAVILAVVLALVLGALVEIDII